MSKKSDKPKRKRSSAAIGKHNQRKGKSWQHAVSRAISYLTDPTGTHNAVSNHGGVRGEEDVLLSKDAAEKFPFFVECKNTQALHIPVWWRKLREDREAAGCENAGLIVSRLYGTSEALVTLDCMVFLEILFPGLSDIQLENGRRILFQLDAKEKVAAQAKLRRQERKMVK